MYHGSIVGYVPLRVLLAAAEQTRAVNDRIHHRVGHPEEKYPDEISVVDMRCIHERVDDKRHLANRSINNEIISDMPNWASERAEFSVLFDTQ